MNGAQLLRCICDETRFEILEILQENEEMCVKDIVVRIKKDQPLISHHLRRLRECGIITSHDEGKKTIYSISNARLSGLIASIADAGMAMQDLCEKESSGSCKC